MRIARPVVFYGSLITLSAAAVMLILWAFSTPHRPIEYMVAGSLATSIGLLAAFIRAVRSRARASSR